MQKRLDHARRRENAIFKPYILAIGLVFGLMLLAGRACSGSKKGSEATASQLAAAGKTVFEQNCMKCHGENGQQVNGSALMGPDNVLANYQTGLGLYNFISQRMPDDNPGGLTPTQYLQVETYLLLQDGYVKPGTPIAPNNLDQISINASH